MRTRHPWLHGQLYSTEDDLTPEEMARVAAAAAEALQGAERAARQLGADWALIGGQALIAYGVPRITTDVDPRARSIPCPRFFSARPPAHGRPHRALGEDSHHQCSHR